MAISLHESGLFTWPQFQGALIARIAAWEAAPAEGKHWSYYQHWLAALEDVLANSDTVHADSITARAHTLAQRPTGHDHPHPH
jgi:nitrile hydratase accessory protein